MEKTKIFKVTGKMEKPNLKTTFSKEVTALKPEDAMEKIYTDLGSRHRIKRYHIKIASIKEISIKETQSLNIKKMFEEEKSVESL